MLQRAEDHFAQLARRRRVLRQLHVVFGARGLMAGGNAAVHPIGLVEKSGGRAEPARRSEHRGSAVTSSDSLGSEFELQPDQRRAARPEHDVRGMQLVVVIAVGDVIDVHLQIDVLGQRMLGHGVEDPVAGDFLHQAGTGSNGAVELAVRLETKLPPRPVSQRQGRR